MAKSEELWDWMMWELSPSGKDPFAYFANKYGQPGAFATGAPYTGPVPDGVVDMSDKVSVPKGHIWIAPQRPGAQLG